MCTHWELEETGYKPIQKNMVGTTKFRTWCEQIENLMGTWWATHVANLRNRLQTHSEEHCGNHKIQNLMWTNWEPNPDVSLMRNRHWELQEQVTNPLRRTWWNHINLRTWCEPIENLIIGTWWRQYIQNWEWHQSPKTSKTSAEIILSILCISLY